MEKLTGFLLLLATLNVSLAQDKGTPKYFKDGGKLTLDLSPRPTEPITNLVWKLKGDLVAEWFKDKVSLTYYRTFRGRATMDLTTGRLDINEMTKADAGVYSAEVNSVVQNARYNAVLIKEVPKPEVVIRPLTCSSASESCTLSCEGDTTDAGPVTYSWKEVDGLWTGSGKDVVLTKEETEGVKTFTCRIENALRDVKESDPRKNPFITEETGGPDVGVIVGSIFGVIILAGILGIVVYFRKKILTFRGCSSPDATVENGRQPDPSGKNSEVDKELDPLNAATKQDG